MPADPSAERVAYANAVSAADAQATPLPAGVDPAAVRDASGGTAPQTVQVEGTVSTTVNLAGPDGAPAAPPVNLNATVRPARPYGAIRQGLRAHQ